MGIGLVACIYRVTLGLGGLGLIAWIGQLWIGVFWEDGG